MFLGMRDMDAPAIAKADFSTSLMVEGGKMGFGAIRMATPATDAFGME